MAVQDDGDAADDGTSGRRFMKQSRQFARRVEDPAAAFEHGQDLVAEGRSHGRGRGFVTKRCHQWPYAIQVRRARRRQPGPERGWSDRDGGIGPVDGHRLGDRVDVPDHERPRGEVIGPLGGHLALGRRPVVVLAPDLDGEDRGPREELHPVGRPLAEEIRGIGRKTTGDRSVTAGRGHSRPRRDTRRRGPRPARAPEVGWRSGTRPRSGHRRSASDGRSSRRSIRPSRRPGPGRRGSRARALMLT